MSILNSRRILGPLNQFPVSGSAGAGGGGGGSGVSINNNVDGYILKATGDSNTVSGVEQFRVASNGTVSGSGQIQAQSFAFEGTNNDGVKVLYKLQVQGGMLSLLSSSLP